MKVIVTGTSGFVGQALVPRLLAAGHEAVPLGRSVGEDGLAWDMASGSPVVLPTDIDAVVHLAQARAYRKFPIDAPDMFAVNVAATHGLLAASAAAGIKRFCLASSGTVYEPYEKPIVEDAALSPTGFLGASKLAAEVVARPYGKLMALSVLRLFVPYGPGQTGRLVPELVRRIRAGERVDISRDGHGVRMTPTHIDDVCSVLLASIEEGWTGTYNVAAPETLSIGEMARLLGGAMGREVLFNRSQRPASSLVPDLSRLSTVYDVQRMRRFSDAAHELVREP